LIFTGAELLPELQIPVLGDFLGFRETLFLGSAVPVLAGKIVEHCHRLLLSRL
jgi:hypothetical protein